MLKPIKTIERLDHITQENPCFTIESDDHCKLYIHAYRKGTRGKMRESECYFDTDCLPDYLMNNQNDNSLSHCMSQVGCCDERFSVDSLISYHHEWHEASGQLKKFCLTDKLFRAHDGIWVIDVYRDVEYLDENNSKVDPTNFYRNGGGCTRIGKDLCKQYEFTIGSPCDDIEIEPCKTLF